MAAYAAVVSLLHVIKQINIYHSRKPVFIEEHLRELELLCEKVTFLQDYLESFPNRGGNNEADNLESRVAEAAYSAEDILESHIIHATHQQFEVEKAMKIRIPKHAIKGDENWNFSHFSHRLQEVMEKMDSVKKDAIKMLKKKPPRHTSSSSEVPSLRRTLTDQNDTTVDIYDKKLSEIMDKLTRQKSHFSIISITGMGGIGKTTLAKTVYNHKCITKHFDKRSWITVSQEYSERQLVLSILDEMGFLFEDPSEREDLDYHQLGLKLHQHLTGRRYFVVIDDLWSNDAWDKIKRFLPDTKGSGILVTSRASNVATSLGCSGMYAMDLLDDNSSWILLSTLVFGQERCPPELEYFGRSIAKNCAGLPLSISVIGGLLGKSEMTQKYWKRISQEISSTVNTQNEGRCLKILSLSYYNLPMHLRPCFLYMGMLPEGHNVNISQLIRLWVAEGFLKPHECKSLEEVAKVYFYDLVERNLILVSEVGYAGNVKQCRIHDLLWDFCLREGHREGFLYNPNMQMSRGLHNDRRIAYSGRSSFSFFDPHTVKTSLARSVVNFGNGLPSFRKFKLLRSLSSIAFRSRDFAVLVNLRYISGRYGSFPSPIKLFWNLHTITFNEVGDKHEGYLPIEIWKMPQFKHIKIEYGFRLRYPEDGELNRQRDIIVLENLQTLGMIWEFKCTEEIIRRIPNINKLRIRYNPHMSRINNISRLNRLQSLHLLPEFYDVPSEVQFPLSLKKLTVGRINFTSEEISQKIGCLPHLEKLRLRCCQIGKEWNTIEGQFLQLKFLEVYYVRGLRYWNAESNHFPILEHLVLEEMHRLEEIPSGVGEIDTLRSIRLKYCCSSLVASAEKIIEEQHSLGNVNLCLQTINYYR